jgi:RNA polymerase sigma-70 factor (ECF subfamily)
MTHFDTTHWSIVLRARGDTADARAALEALCRRYRPPVLAYIKRRGHSAEDAEDLAQTFFTRFLEDAYYATADPARGRFRALLLTALKRFLIDADAHAHALKRGGGVPLRSLDSGFGSEAPERLADDATPENAFDRDWAATVLEAAMQRLREEAKQAGRQRLFDHLSEFLLERPDEADYARVAAALALRRNTLAVAVHRLRQRLRELVREELAQTTTDQTELESELRQLRGAFHGVMS